MPSLIKKQSRFYQAILLLIFSLGLSFSAQAATNCAAVTEIPQSECEALIAFYDSTTGDNWTDNTDWKVTNTPCSWKGVFCIGGNVTGLDFYDNQLIGVIPIELGNLSNLRWLYLIHNQLTGNIPVELANLSNLEQLDLTGNQLTGNIPPELGNLSNLLWLSLTGNQLTGNIPVELGNLSNLQYLYLSRNQLTGNIPVELGNLSNLQSLYLYYNQLTGIPTELGNLSNLEELYLTGNQLTGNIPSELGNLSNLQGLFLDSNQLTGNIPVELGNLSNLGSLFLDSNQLTGNIPVELGNLSNLGSLYLYDNQLTGNIPAELGNLSNLQSLWLNNNQLTGNIPTELGNLSNLQSLLLNNNQLTGNIPAELGNLSNLKWLYLGSNQLTGSIPDLSTLTSLQSLNLSGNSLCRDATINYSPWEEEVNIYPLCEGSTNTAYPINISTRSPVRGGANNTIAGFIISGTGTKKVVIRAEGKGLASRLPTGSQVLADAKLVLYKLVNGAWQVIAENDNWQSDSRASEIPAHMQLTDVSDAGLLRNLEAGVYTAIVQPATTSTATGVTLVSVNDLDNANTKTSELINISTRAPIEGGTGNVIAGFIVSGTGTQNVVITARGKSVNMSQDVVCQDPAMTVYQMVNGAWEVIATNDNWQTDAQSTNIPAHLQPTDASDSALFLSLEASPYTAIMSCKSGTGVGLIGVNTVD